MGIIRRIEDLGVCRGPRLFWYPRGPNPIHFAIYESCSKTHTALLSPSLRVWA